MTQPGPAPGLAAARRPLVRHADGLIERTLDVATEGGQMQTFLVHPESAAPHPVCLLYMDAVGYREELKTFARRFARRGYFAMLPNLYYRDGGPSFDPWDPSTLTPWILPLAYALTNQRVMRDTAALLRFAEADPAAGTGPKACVGYCMGGRMALAAAGTFAADFAAAASLYGGRQVTDEPDSPHRVAMRSNGEFYVAFAGIDRHVPDEQRARLQADFAAQGINVTIELFPEAAHGFAFPERHCYEHTAAERSWQRVLELFDRRTKPGAPIP